MSDKQVTISDKQFSELLGACGAAVGLLQRLADGVHPATAEELKQKAQALKVAVFETVKDAGLPTG